MVFVNAKDRKYQFGGRNAYQQSCKKIKTFEFL